MDLAIVRLCDHTSDNVNNRSTISELIVIVSTKLGRLILLQLTVVSEGHVARCAYVASCLCPLINTASASTALLEYSDLQFTLQ